MGPAAVNQHPEGMCLAETGSGEELIHLRREEDA